MGAKITEAEYQRLRSRASKSVRFVESSQSSAARRPRPRPRKIRRRSPWRDAWPAMAAIGSVALLGFMASREGNLRGLAQSAAPSLSQLVNDLLAMQGEVQQYAPQLASRWGWLAAQGQALESGQGVKIAPSVWLTEYRAFWNDLQAALPSQDAMVAANFVNNVGSDASQGFPQGLTADAQTYGGAAAAAGQGAASVLSTLENDAIAAIPWVVGGVLALLFLPSLISAVKSK